MSGSAPRAAAGASGSGLAAARAAAGASDGGPVAARAATVAHSDEVAAAQAPAGASDGGPVAAAQASAGASDGGPAGARAATVAHSGGVAAAQAPAGASDGGPAGARAATVAYSGEVAAAQVSAIHGIVLAGGRSSRMGTDKARLAMDGVPLLRRIVEAIAPLCCGVTVVVPASDPQRYADLLGPIAALAADRYADKGPLAGIHAGLLAMPDDCACGFVIACDMPRFSPQLLRRMAAELAARSPAPEAVLCPGQPLHALYSRTAAQTAERLLAAGRLQLHALADSLRTAYVEPLDADCFLNLNTPEEWQAYIQSSDGGDQDMF